MFESSYGLGYLPFSRDVPTSELYKSVILEGTLGRLEYAAQRQWFALVTDDCNTGKTTTIRRFPEVLNPTKYKVLYLQAEDLPFIQGIALTAWLRVEVLYGIAASIGHV